MPKQATAPPIGFRGDMPNGFNPQDAAHLNCEDLAHIARRQRLLGPAYRLFYKSPVEVSRAKGVFLYDKHGNEYLDAYNNVVSLGHGHARVVEAIQKQLAVLCTHTRYMQEPLLDYAESLMNTFAGELGRTGCAMFTCTGSEANDLALRIARYRGFVAQSLEELQDRAGPPDVVVVDPPRAGLAGKALRRTGELAARRLVYVSCNPTTLASDLKVLRDEYGYELRRVTPVDMFPHTPHIESVSLLERP